jgi:hypothetical protein
MTGKLPFRKNGFATYRPGNLSKALLILELAEVLCFWLWVLMGEESTRPCRPLSAAGLLGTL